MLAWELPSAAWDTQSVKFSRCIIGTRRVSLLHSEPLRDFSMPRCAAEYGPGTYRLNPGPGPYSNKSVTLEISEEYARREGWGQAPAPAPMPSPQMQLAAETFSRAQEGPVSRLELAAMIQAAVESSKKQEPAVNPMDLLMKGFELSNTFQSKSLELARSMVGVGTTERAPATVADVLMELGPSILETIKSIAPAIIGAATRPAPPPPTPQPAQRVPQPTINTGAEPMSRELAPRPEPVAPTQMTEEETNAAAPIIAVMKPYAGILAAQLQTASPEELAQQLGGLLGPELDASILALDDACLKYGPAVLAHIGPGLSTPGAAIVVHELARIIKMQDEETQL